MEQEKEQKQEQNREQEKEQEQEQEEKQKCEALRQSVATVAMAGTTGATETEVRRRSRCKRSSRSILNY